MCYFCSTFVADFKLWISMATYAMTINERTTQGKALLSYLGALNISLVPIDRMPCSFSAKEMRDILAQSASEARSGGGTPHEDFKREIAYAG